MQKDTMIDDTAEAANEFAKNVEDTVKTIFETTRAATSKALKATQEKIEENEDAIGQGVRRSLDLIKQYPLESAIVCLGVGFLIGKLLGRSK